MRLRAIRYGLPTVAGVEVLYHTRERRDLQDVLTCIRHGVPLSRAGRLTKPNAEHVLKPPFVFRLLFEDDPLTVVRTVEVAERCTFSLDELRYRYPSEKLPDGTTSSEWLQSSHVRRRRRNATLSSGIPTASRQNVVAQIDKELALIDELEYDGYFLTMWEIVQFCRRSKILCQGRGSAANSAVCYCLGITAVDPVQMDLLFERFISRERAEPPDIDLDIEHNRREEVIQYVYEKYGRSHAAMVANVVRYRARSALREVGKVLEIPDTTLDRVAKLLSHYDDITRDTLDRAGFDPENAVHQHLARLAAEIQDFPRHLSIHPGGFLLGHKPVRRLVPIENATMPGRTVIQWDKDDLESLGLFKVDLLGLGMLSVLSRSFDSIEEHYGKRMGMADVPDDDEPTFEMIRRADTVGVFQIESRAQMAMLPRLRPRNYYDIVIEVSIVRPGPITGGMVHPYLATAPRRGRGRLSASVSRARVEKNARCAALPGTGDEARRGRGGLHAGRSRPAPARHGRVEARGASRPPPRASRHADAGQGDRAGVRREGLRADPRVRRLRFPREPRGELCVHRVRVGVAQAPLPGSLRVRFVERAADGVLLAGYYNRRRQAPRRARAPRGCSGEPVGLHAGAAFRDGNGGSGGLPPRGNGERLAPDMAACDSGNGGAPAGTNGGRKLGVRVGLRYVRGFREEDGRKIEAARQQGPFVSIDDFISRTGLEDGALARLAEAGAFERLESHRRNALWTIRGHDRETVPRLAIQNNEPRVDFRPLNDFETIGWDYDSTGHSTRGHPLSPVREELRSLGLPDARTVTGGTERTAAELRRDRHQPPASVDGQGSRLHDARGRDGFRQRGDLEERVPKTHGDRQDGVFSRGERQDPIGFGGGPSRRRIPVGPRDERPAAKKEEPGLSLEASARSPQPLL